MRIKIKRNMKNKYAGGFSTKITKFLLLPKVIDGELRWLETATFKRQRSRIQVFDYNGERILHSVCNDTEWVNK